MLKYFGKGSSPFSIGMETSGALFQRVLQLKAAVSLSHALQAYIQIVRCGQIRWQNVGDLSVCVLQCWWSNPAFGNISNEVWTLIDVLLEFYWLAQHLLCLAINVFLLLAISVVLWLFFHYSNGVAECDLVFQVCKLTGMQY